MLWFLASDCAWARSKLTGERVQDQRRLQVRVHRPADEPARVHIQHHRQVQEPRPRRDVGDVSYPQLIRLGRLELALDQINGLRRQRIARGSHHVLAQRGALKTRRAHQSCNALARRHGCHARRPAPHGCSATRTHRASGDGCQRSCPSAPDQRAGARTWVEPAMHRTRSSIPAALGTSARPNGWPGSPKNKKAR